MNAYENLNDSIWHERYNFSTNPLQKGKIVSIEGVGDKDTYNPSLCEYDGQKVLAFRLEDRESDIFNIGHYHPSICFATETTGGWKVSFDIAAFDMLEDPLFMEADLDSEGCLVLGGVRAKLLADGKLQVNTELYKGKSLAGIERKPFAIIEGMKDERLCQLPDGRFLLCKRPLDKEGLGYVAVHIIDSLRDLVSINSTISLPVAELRGLYDDDLVGINNIYIFDDNNGLTWVGLLGHIAILDEDKTKHYAATTYKIKLDDLINGRSNDMKPTVIAIRSCFEDGPKKNDKLGDVVFPGSLEKIGDNKYRLWTGLSDARIGVIDLIDPFRLNTI